MLKEWRTTHKAACCPTLDSKKKTEKNEQIGAVENSLELLLTSLCHFKKLFLDIAQVTANLM
jgi:hypothetical protein